MGEVLITVSGYALLHPWLLVGLVGASLPILIHLIGRRRAPTLSFAAFDFLVAVNKRLARRERLRQILLLLLRTLALVALALAVSRPMPERPAMVSETDRKLVLVVDASASMGYDRGGRTLLDEAKKRARDVLSHLNAGDPVTLVIAGDEVHTPFQSPTIDHDAVRAAIDAIGAPSGVADLGAAIEQGLSQVGDDGAGVVLVVVSDLSQNSFEGLRPSTLEPPPEIRLLDAAAPLARGDEPMALGNVAIEGLQVERGEVGSGATTERRFRVGLRNFGAVPVSGRVIELVIDSEVTHRGFLDIPARGGVEKILTASFDGPGLYEGMVRLGSDLTDGFATDDIAHFVTEVTRGVRVLAVNGDPRTTPYEDELFFIERALLSVPKGDPGIALQIVTVDELAEVELGGFDLLLLANVPSLAPADLSRLRSFVRDGGGLLFALGDRIKFESFNSEFGALLPHPLRDLHRAADPDAGSPPVGIGDMDWDHPILADLGLPVEQSLHSSRTGKYFNLDVGAGIEARAILRFDNGALALVERRDGDGRVILLTTSIDVDFSDIPLRSAFPPLAQRTVRYLANAIATGAPEGVREGESLELPLPTGASGIALVSPKGERRESLSGGEGKDGSGRARFADLHPAGIYRAEILHPPDSWQPEPRLNVAVNPTLLESDFAPISAARVSQALGGQSEDRRLSVLVGASAEVDPFDMRGLAPYLLIVLCLLFASESLLASRG